MSDSGTETATVAVTDDSFSQDVLSSSTPVLVDFWATWCGPCKTLGPMLEKAVTAAKGAVSLLPEPFREGAKRAKDTFERPIALSNARDCEDAPMKINPQPTVEGKSQKAVPGNNFAGTDSASLGVFVPPNDT